MENPRRTYPLRQWPTDSRFSYALVRDVANVLTAHGYPLLADSGDDHVELGQILLRFLYDPTT
ncbi:hypothetical protein [Amycolatopsis sp. CA-128772]|uniref:hypothetical protein n=1 Tax=Amycolatopsis sp. CA-128772 TaxID=2073159 RepID=UPI000CD2E352|nr:hypothetical protein [Amycolatopsis sp. CA-128772]